MRVRVRLALPGDPEGVLAKMAGVSAVAHAIGLVVFSLLPRFGKPPEALRATIATIVPASALRAAASTGAPPRSRSDPTPSQRAEQARKATEPSPPPAPTPKPIPPPPGPRAKKSDRPKQEPAAPAPDPPATSPEEVAPGAPPPEPSAGDAGGISFGAPGAASFGGIPTIGSSGFPYDYYRSSLVAILQSSWRRPVAPEGLAAAVECRVVFTILKSGIIKDPRVASPSGNAALDQSALRAVYDSSPLPPLPVQYGHASVSAEVVFELTPD